MRIPAAKAAEDKEWEKLEEFSAWNLTKVKSKKQVIDEARTSGATVHFASLMDICHLKNTELEAKQKYKGRVVLRGDIVKDDSGSYAVFTEQGSSASQMTAAKIMDIIFRLPGAAVDKEWDWKNYSSNLHSIKNKWENITFKQMFAISEQLMLEQSDEIYGVNPINWEDSSSLVNDEEIISLLHAKVYVFSDSVMSRKFLIRTQHQIRFGKKSCVGSKIHHNTELWTPWMVSRWNSSGILSQDSPHCSSATKSKSS